MKVKQDPNPIIICRSCGADYSAALPNCPYCDTMNLPAAEDAYMNKLEHMRGNLEGLGGLAGQQTRTGLRSMHKKILLAAVFLFVAVAVFYGVHLYQARAEAQREKEEMCAQQKKEAEKQERLRKMQEEIAGRFGADALRRGT